MSDASAGYDPDIDDTAGVPVELADDTSARARSQRGLNQARSAMFDAATRARDAATFPTRRTVPADEVDNEEPSRFSAVADHVAAYRTYITAAVLTALGLLALARKRRTANVDDTVDLGDWRLHAEPADR